MIALYNPIKQQVKVELPNGITYQRPMVATDVGGLSEGLDMPIAKIVSPYGSSIAAGLETILKADPPSKKDFVVHQEQRSWKNFAQKNTDFCTIFVAQTKIINMKTLITYFLTDSFTF